MTTQLASVSVEITNGQPTTTSLDVATHFGKQHKDVLRAIANLDCSPEFSQRNFAQAYQEVAQPNGGTAKYPMVRLTRDGFTFLCMGFTGKEAAKWKEAYINAFNQMEAALKDPAHKPTNGRPADHQPMTMEQRQEITDAAQRIIQIFPVSQQDQIRRMIAAETRCAFGNPADADARQFLAVMTFIHSLWPKYHAMAARRPYPAPAASTPPASTDGTKRGRGRPRKNAPAATTTRTATPDTRPTPLAILAMDTAALAIEGIDELLSCCASVPPRMMATARMYRELLQLNWNDAHAARLAMVPA